MSPVLVLLFTLAQARALPTDANTTAHAYYNRRRSGYSDGANPLPIILGSLGALVFISFAIVVTLRYKKKRDEGRGSAGTGTSGAGTGSNNTTRSTTRQTRRNRQQTQNSARNLPIYNEQLPDGEIVLLERVKRNSTSENNGSTEATTVASSANVAEPESLITPSIHGAADTAASPPGDVPTYEEATTPAVEHTVHSTEASGMMPTRIEHR